MAAKYDKEYNKDKDYGEYLEYLMESGASPEEVGENLKLRIQKATSEPGLSEYAYDDLHDRTLNYIANYKKPEVSAAAGGTAPGTSSYVSPYSGAINSLLSEILNPGKFSYDPETDQTYQRFKEQYTRLGEQAMKDTIGQVSARTGGIASSYAATAANQANNAYMAALSDRIPELEQLAYERYMNEQSQNASKLGLLQGLDESQYSRYRDTVGDSQWQQTFDYGKERDTVSDYKWQQEFEYQKEQDALDRAAYEDATAFERAMTKWRTTGTLDKESAAVLGLKPGLKTTDYQYQLAQLSLDRAAMALNREKFEYEKQQPQNTGQSAEQLAEYTFISDYLKDRYQSGKMDVQGMLRYLSAQESDLISRMGKDAYQQLLTDVSTGFSDSIPEIETYGALYQGMMDSGDPEKWLQENADWLTNDEIKWLVGQLPNDSALLQYLLKQ